MDVGNSEQDGVRPGVVAAEVAYGNDTAFRDELTALGLRYAVGIQAQTTVWPEGARPLPPPEYPGTGRPPKLLRRDPEHPSVSVQQRATSLPASAFRTVCGREVTRGERRSRFARVRVRAAPRDYWRGQLGAEEWLLIEWPAGDSAPPPSMGCPPCPRRCRCERWSRPRSCAGASSGTSKSSSKSAG
jgi:SRSO17 transposase